jgi:hypothetical protein
VKTASCGDFRRHKAATGGDTECARQQRELNRQQLTMRRNRTCARSVRTGATTLPA